MAGQQQQQQQLGGETLIIKINLHPQIGPTVKGCYAKLTSILSELKDGKRVAEQEEERAEGAVSGLAPGDS